eukprot:31304-Pelagococcus_subviridis.AAC.23
MLGAGCPRRACSAVTRCCSTSICSYSAAVERSESLPLFFARAAAAAAAAAAATAAAAFFRRFRSPAVSAFPFTFPFDGAISPDPSINAAASGANRGCVIKTGAGGGVCPVWSRRRFIRTPPPFARLGVPSPPLSASTSAATPSASFAAASAFFAAAARSTGAPPEDPARREASASRFFAASIARSMRS